MTRHGRALGRIADHEQQIGLVRLWPGAQVVQESHRLGRVSKHAKARMVERGDKETYRNADAFGNGVVLLLAVLANAALTLTEERDNPRGVFKIWLVRIGAERRERIEPCLTRLAGIEFTLFLLGQFAQSLLLAGRTDRAEMPCLMGTSRRKTGSGNRGFDHGDIDRTIREIAHRVAEPNSLEEGPAFVQNSCRWQFDVIHQGD